MPELLLTLLPSLRMSLWSQALRASGGSCHRLLCKRRGKASGKDLQWIQQLQICRYNLQSALLALTSAEQLTIMADRNLILLVFVLLFISTHSVLSSASSHDSDEVEDESAFAYENGTDNGPEKWGHIDPNWKVCETGKLQSPIDLLDQRVEVLPRLGKLKREYKPAAAVLKNRGHDISVKWKGDAGKIVINGTDYKLLQCHWHTPSEHTVNETRFKMELHLVHRNSHGQLAVIGILYKLGHPDSFLAKLLHHVTTAHAEIDLGVVSPGEIKFGSRKYYRYIGSLTVPPCSEGVLWTILKKVRTVSREQIRTMRDVVHDGFEANARPIQRQNGRPVYFYRPVA